MTEVDSEIVEDTKNTPLADVTDDSCVLKLIEIVPLDRTADDDQKPEVVPPLFVLKPEVLQDVKQELADDCNTEGQTPSCTIQVRSTSSHVVLGVVAFFIFISNCKRCAIEHVRDNAVLEVLCKLQFATT